MWIRFDEIRERAQILRPNAFPDQFARIHRQEAGYLALVQTSGEWRDDGGMRQFEPLDSIFKGRHFEREIIILCVRWYLSFKLSFRDLVAMMAERGIWVAHSTILRWVEHFTPEFERRWQRFARSLELRYV